MTYRADNELAPTEHTRTEAVAAPSGNDDSRRWLALGVICIAQLMIVLDLAVVFVALPSIQSSLHISTADRQWAVSAYAITFGGCLLLGGRVVDYLGRKRMFITALIGFSLVSALGGLAPNAAMLFTARAAQGVLAAVVAPAVLSLISVSFTEPPERAKAFGVYGMVSGSGAAIGMLVGGALTYYASWRWVLLINVPIALGTALAATWVLRAERPNRPDRYDVLGAVTATAGAVLLAEGFTNASKYGWGSWPTVASLTAGVVLLAGFFLLEARTTAPLLPLRIITQFRRGLLYLTSLFANAAQLSMFLFLTYYFQSVLNYNAIRTGFVFLPFALALILTAVLSPRVLAAIGPLPAMLVGAVLAVIALLSFSRLSGSVNYLLDLALPEALMGMGVGLSLFPLNNVVLRGIEPSDAGVASALVSTTQQIGGSVGTALLNTIFAVTVAAFVPANSPAAPIHGYNTVFVWEAVMYAIAFALIAVVWRTGRGNRPA